jgi:hypothetical protein
MPDESYILKRAKLEPLPARLSATSNSSVTPSSRGGEPSISEFSSYSSTVPGSPSTQHEPVVYLNIPSNSKTASHSTSPESESPNYNVEDDKPVTRMPDDEINLIRVKEVDQVQLQRNILNEFYSQFPINRLTLCFNDPKLQREFRVAFNEK